MGLLCFGGSAHFFALEIIQCSCALIQGKIAKFVMEKMEYMVIMSE